jgi:hypothetical protein
MKPIAISGVGTEPARASATQLLAWGAIVVLVGYIFVATLDPPKKKS